jgi:hypothetical protein
MVKGTLALVLAAVVAGLVASAAGCMPPSRQLDTTSMVAAADDSLVYAGMTVDDVEERWGDTDCIYESVVEGYALDVLGYGIAANGEVVGIENCTAASVALFFHSGRLVAWGEYE